MKEKQKAQELIEKHLGSIIFNIKQNIEVSVLNAAKKSALITIDEIIEELGEEFVNAIEFWKKVRKEVKNL